MTVNKDYYVYIYKDPDTLEPIYVGKGKDKRAEKHLKLARLYQKEHRFYDKLREILAADKQPIIEFHERDLDEEAAYAIEQILIDQFGVLDKHDGGKLLNISVVAKPSWLGKNHGPWTDEQKLEHSRLMKAYMADPEVRKKVSEAKTGKPGPIMSEEAREKIRKALTGSKNPKGSLAKMGSLNPAFGKKWYNDGSSQTVFIPGTQPEGWTVGKLKISHGKKFYTNLIEDRLFVPGTEPAGYKPGRFKTYGKPPKRI